MLRIRSAARSPTESSSRWRTPGCRCQNWPIDFAHGEIIPPVMDDMGILPARAGACASSNILAEGHFGPGRALAKDNLEPSSSNAALSERALGVLRTLGLGDDSGVEFSADSNPGRVSIVHGLTADVIWCDDTGRETTSTSQFATTLNLSPVAGDWVSIRDGYIVAVSPRYDRVATSRRHAR